MPVGSGDLLGIKVIKLNKIKGTQTIGSKSCSLLETGASFFSKLETSGYRLKPKTLKPKSRRFAVSLRTTKISAQIRHQKIGVRLMPNEKS
jgi:hypothetical protein